jgi:hypothetical protein
MKRAQGMPDDGLTHGPPANKKSRTTLPISPRFVRMILTQLSVCIREHSAKIPASKVTLTPW